MSEYKQQNSTYVSPEEYIESRPWRASAEDLVESLDNSVEEATARGRFTLRLLDDNRSDAHDQLVEVVAANPLGSEGSSGALLVMLSQVLRDENVGALQHVQVSADGIILNSNSNTPNFEKGYFVGGEGVGEDELLDVDLELLIPKEEPALKVMAAPLEFSEY